MATCNDNMLSSKHDYEHYHENFKRSRRGSTREDKIRNEHIRGGTPTQAFDKIPERRLNYSRRCDAHIAKSVESRYTREKEDRTTKNRMERDMKSTERPAGED